MDPLSISASIVGILSAAAKVSSLLITFVQNTKDAPKLAQRVLADVNALSAILSHLQTYLLGTANSSKSRASMILVEQVIVALTKCVTTFSELEDVLGTARLEGDLGILDRVKWSMKESKVADIQGRLQSNKASLNLMLTILQCKSMEEAESAMTRLFNLVEQVITSNKEMRLRLRNMEGVSGNEAPSKNSYQDPERSIKSSKKSIPYLNASEYIPKSPLQGGSSFAFEEDLFASRVYCKPLFSESGESLMTSAARSTSTSILSALSLTDVSNISILAVPVYAHDISNGVRYTFGDFPLKEPEKEDEKPDIGDQRKGKVAVQLAPSQAERKILGIQLAESIKYANVPISLSNAQGEKFIYGYIPIFVGKIGMFLKDKALNVPGIFSFSGSPLRMQRLEACFENPPKYGKDINWSGYTVHDAASILMRYLLGFPESIIPIDHYEAFQAPSRSFHDDHEIALSTYQRLIDSLPDPSRHILIYLLDILGVFAFWSHINEMTSAHLAEIFQPAILSLIKVGDKFIEDPTSRRLSQDVVNFLIENQDSFCIA